MSDLNLSPERVEGLAEVADGHTEGQGTHEPGGCRWCGTGERQHASRFTPSVGQHLFAAPTQAQRLARMRARR